MNKGILIVCIILAVLCTVIAFLSGQRFSKARKELDVERYKRMVAEEKLSQAYSKIKSVEIQMGRKQDQLESIKALLEQEKMAAGDLQRQLDKVLELNTQLGVQLKEMPHQGLPSEGLEEVLQGDQQEVQPEDQQE